MMLQLKDIKNVYFIGIGGIGMSAIARFFKFEGMHVAGYDRVSTVLTKELEQEGIDVHYQDDIKQIALNYHNKINTLIVYTPAIPDRHTELTYFVNNGFDVRKRAAVLGLISSGMNGICVAGTHGKTTISSMTAHLYKQSKVGCSAFLGGIINNYKTNFLHNSESSYVVLEADEFDRSFLYLQPHFALISAMDADHLDIYGDVNNVTEAFHSFVDLIEPGGALLHKVGLPLTYLGDDVEIFTYSTEQEGDFYPVNMKMMDGMYEFDLKSPFGTIKHLRMGVPGLVNVENAVGAIGLALLGGVEADEIRTALPDFKGIRRRFEYRIKTAEFVFIDDYAHHPQEINATVKSVRAIYPNKKLTVVFQPHLYTRTRDFAFEFASALDKCDRVILLDIYPARELPLEGVTSEMIMDLMKLKNVAVVSKEQLFEYISKENNELVLTLGAGDIDKEIPLLEAQFRAFINNI